jgi:hypothetical protein
MGVSFSVSICAQKPHLRFDATKLGERVGFYCNLQWERAEAPRQKPRMRIRIRTLRIYKPQALGQKPPTPTGLFAAQYRATGCRCAGELAPGSGPKKQKTRGAMCYVLCAMHFALRTAPKGRREKKPKKKRRK